MSSAGLSSSDVLHGRRPAPAPARLRAPCPCGCEDDGWIRNPDGSMSREHRKVEQLVGGVEVERWWVETVVP